MCEICKSSNVTIFDVNGYDHAKCKNCGLTWLLKPPHNLKSLYKDPNYFNSNGGYYEDYFSTWSERLNLARKCLKQIESFTPPRRVILDIGCSDGALLCAAVEQDWTAVGVDISPEATRRAVKLGLSAYIEDVETSKGPPGEGCFGVVILRDVLEHIVDTEALFAYVKKALTLRGILWIETPNAGSFNAKFYGPRWVLYQPPFHVKIFTPKALKSLLHKEGFKIERLSSNRTLFHNEIGGSRKLTSKVVNLVFDYNFIHKIVSLTTLGSKITAVVRSE